MKSQKEIDILHGSQVLFDELVKIRRRLHQIPEPGYEEKKTSRYLAAVLNKWDISFKQGFAGTGIIAEIETNPSKKTVALRADMDGLPIDEQTDYTYQSKHKGFFHACGHDMHMTCLLGALKLIKDYIKYVPVNVKGIFQPAEELVPGGARAVIRGGALQNPDVDAIFGLHVDPLLRTGSVALKSGPMMASTSKFKIRIIGKGGHAAKAFRCIDPISIVAHVITAIQTISSRMIDPLTPAVISVTKIHAGTAANVIPEKAELEGTARALDSSTADMIPEKMENLIKGIVSGYGAGYEFEYTRGTNVLVNEEAMTKHVQTVGRELLGSDAVLPYKGTFGGEDFAEYLLHIPGCFFRLGCARSSDSGSAGLHHPKFNPDEKALQYGSAMLAAIVMQFSAEGTGASDGGEESF